MKSTIIFLVGFGYWLMISPVNAQTPTSNPLCGPGESACWPMVAGNPQRTSYTAEEVRGNLGVAWYRPIEPYIPYKFQVIAAQGKLYISSAKGLYALNATTGNVDWVFPTVLPLGNSPTYNNGVVYVGSYDQKIYALNASTGQKMATWNPGNQIMANGGFETNPLVVNNTVYAGNRDGYLYAFNQSDGSLKWKFPTDAPVLFSPALSSDNTILYFASNDMYAYAVRTVDGIEVWKSTKLLGAGFYSFWPVVYHEPVSNHDYVVFSGSDNYREEDGYFHTLENTDLLATCTFPGGLVGPVDSSSPPHLDATCLASYLKSKPFRRTQFVLDALTGQEYTYNGGYFMPYVWAGTTHSGNKFPPVVGNDGWLYSFNLTHYDQYIPGGGIEGWQFGTNNLNYVQTGPWLAVDEPVGFSVGGNVIYWNLCCDRSSGAFDYKTRTSWSYFDYDLFDSSKAGNTYQPNYWGNDYNGWGVYGTVNGVYGKHGAQNPPIPYQGRVYMQRGNSLFAFAPSGTRQILPLASIVNSNSTPPPVLDADLKQKLAAAVQAMINAGHLRPGYHSTGIFDNYAFRLWSGNMEIGLPSGIDYYSNPSDTQVALIRALPYLSSTLAQQTKTYLQTEFTNYPLTSVAYTGWQGADRALGVIPADKASGYNGNSSGNLLYGSPWSFPPESFYGAWKYAGVFGGSKTLFDSMKTKFPSDLTDANFMNPPYYLNLYLSGLKGYLELEKLAGYTTNINQSTKYADYTRLLALRINNFSKDTAFPVNQYQYDQGWDHINYNRALNVARNFMFLYPEVAADLLAQPNALTKIQSAVTEYQTIAPYWFVSHFDDTTGEGTLQQGWDVPSIFFAKAYFLKQSKEELAQYLDVPAYSVGDLFYIQNLVATLEAPAASAAPIPGDYNGDGVVDYRDRFAFIPNFGTGNSTYKLVPGSLVNIFDLNKLVGLLFR